MAITNKHCLRITSQWVCGWFLPWQEICLKGQEVPFVIYADFEAINEKVHRCKPNNDKSYTESYQKHKDCGYGYEAVCCYDDKYSEPAQQIYRGKNAVHKFIEKMLEEVEWFKKMKHKHFNKDMIPTKDDKKISKTLINVIFVIKNTLKKTFV